MSYEFISSPNFWKGRRGFSPDAIVVHRAEGSMKGTIAWFLTPESQVSAHFVIAKNGYIVQMVNLHDTAWHAGIVKDPKWTFLKPGVNPNLYTIGIELEGYAGEPAPFVQHLALKELIEKLCQDFNISQDLNHIIPHNYIRADKACPGQGVNLNFIIN